MHCWADLQAVHGSRCYDNIVPNAKCQRVLVFDLCLVVVSFQFKALNSMTTCVAEFSFASYPASMVAGGSVLAAAHGILGRAWTESTYLVTKLQHITSVDAVRCQRRAL